MHDERHIIRLTKVKEPPPAYPPALPVAQVQEPVQDERPRIALKKPALTNIRYVQYAVGALVALIVFTYIYSHMHPPAPSTVPSQMRSETDGTIVQKVGKLMQLPEEQAVMAVVSDLQPLKTEAFFRNAEVGDVLLMFPKAAKAVLYRPGEDKIIEVAPITK